MGNASRSTNISRCLPLIGISLLVLMSVDNFPTLTQSSNCPPATGQGYPANKTVYYTFNSNVPDPQKSQLQQAIST